MPRLSDGEGLPRLSVRSRSRPHAVTTIVVTAAVVERDGRFLVTRRQRGVHLEGFWEFPGGKCDAGESHAACLARELHEELAVDAHIGSELFTTTHTYPDRIVELHFLRCELVGEPAPQIGQEMRWVARADLAALEFPPADVELIRMLEGARHL
jgi:8-oxo-dGTP diphosphatase